MASCRVLPPPYPPPPNRKQNKTLRGPDGEGKSARGMSQGPRLHSGGLGARVGGAESSAWDLGRRQGLESRGLGPGAWGQGAKATRQCRIRPQVGQGSPEGPVGPRAGTGLGRRRAGGRALPRVPAPPRLTGGGSSGGSGSGGSRSRRESGPRCGIRVGIGARPRAMGAGSQGPAGDGAAPPQRGWGGRAERVGLQPRAGEGPGSGRSLESAGPERGPGGAQALRIARGAFWWPPPWRWGRPGRVGLMRGHSVPACLERRTGELAVFVWLDGRSTPERSSRGPLFADTAPAPQVCSPPHNARSWRSRTGGAVWPGTSRQETHFP